MKRFSLEFMRRGAVASGIGPLIFAVLYLILQNHLKIETLTVNAMCIGIFSLTVLAFIAGGMNAIYQLEKLPLMVAVLIHGAVLYGSYLGAYLLNGWLDRGMIPVLVFSCILACIVW